MNINFSQWTEDKMGNLVRLAQGLAINKKTKHLIVESGGLPLLRIKDLFEDSFEQFINPDKAPKQCRVLENDILFTRTGQVGFVFTGRTGILHNNCFKIVPKKNVTRGFIYWYLKLPNVINYLQNLASGAAQPDLGHKAFNSLVISYPNETEQEKISSLLFSFDSLIKNNQKRIKILEEMAQLLYREWFVEFRFPGHEKIKMVDSSLGRIPRGWKVEKIGERLKVKRGKMITSETVIEGSIPVIAGGLEPTIFHNTYNVTAPAITISASGANAGYVNIHGQNIWASDCSYISKKETTYVYYYYLQLKTRQYEVTNLQVGAAQPHVNPRNIMNLDTLHPNSEVIGEFEKTMDPIFMMIFNLKNQNMVLKKTRDLLLPKLMFGEIEV